MLPACAGDTVFSPYRAVDDLDSFLRYAAPDGEAQLDIYGNPFDVSSQALAQALIASFEDGVWHGPDMRFSTRSSSARTDYRFVVVFCASPSLSGDELCKSAKALTLSPAQRPITAKLAFCLKDRDYSEAQGQGGAINDPQSSEFRRWARNLMRALTPPPQARYNPAD